MSNWPTWDESSRRREKAIKLRKQGLSYGEIRDIVGGSSASMSVWLRDIPVPASHATRVLARRWEAAQKTAAAHRRRRLEKELRIRREAVGEVGAVSDRDVFVAGIALYAAEGTKQKAWGKGMITTFINSDPRMIRLFLRWLQLLGIESGSLKFLVAIHESADVGAAIEFWARQVGVPPHKFLRPNLKRGNPKTLRKNVGADYRGCLVIKVVRSVDLTRRIEGWFDALVRGSEGAIHSDVPIPRPILGATR